MRYLSLDEISNALDRRKSVEQFLGDGNTTGSISWVELRPNADQVELWFFEAEDVGDSEFIDIYSFPETGKSSEEPIGRTDSTAEALALAQGLFGASPSQWLNQGMIQSCYAATKV